MCQLKSAVILKDRVFVPDYDSHQKMLEELGIEDTRENASRIFVRAELIPQNRDVFSDIATWTYRVDQDIMPDWYVEDYDKSRMVDAVKAWAKNRIHIGVDGLVIDSGAGHYIKDCHDVTICGSASVESIYGSASVKHIYDSASVKKVSGFSCISSSNCVAWENKNRLVLCQNATFRDLKNKKIYQCGDFELVSVGDGNHV